MYLFARGMDDAVWFRVYDGGWGPWTSLGGIATGQPAAVRYRDRRVGVFVRGLDGALWYRELGDGGAPTNWRSLGGQIIGDPVAVASSSEVVTVVAKGLDRQVWANFLTVSNNQWSGWVGPPADPHPGIYAGPLSIAPGNADGDFFVAGVGDGHQFVMTYVGMNKVVYPSWQEGASLTLDGMGSVFGQIWAKGVGGNLLRYEADCLAPCYERWRNFGGILTSAPSTGLGGTGWVLARGLDGALWSLDAANGSWTSLGGATLEGATTGRTRNATGPDVAVIAVRGTDTAVWIRMSFDYETLELWQSLGGLVKGPPVAVSWA